MKNFIYKSLLLAICSTAVIACKPTLELTVVNPGTADFTRFVSIGDGTPGGYSDASLNREAQLVAFPNLLAEQFKLVGMHGDFAQPLILPYVSTVNGHTYTGIGFENGKVGTQYDLQYRTLCGGKPELHPEMIDSSILKSNDLLAVLNFKVEPPPAGGYYNNLAAQGVKLIYMNMKPNWFHAPKTSSTSSTYWTKISSTLGTTGPLASTMLQDAMVQKPTFVSINAGGTDVLRFAKSGGDQDNGDDDMITPLSEFHDSLYSLMNTLTAKNAGKVKGVIVNIIGLSSFPYFNYIKYNGLVLTSTQADELNTLYAGQLTFHVGTNNYVIDDQSATNSCKCRQIKDDEYVLIEIQDSLRWCYGIGSKVPLRKRWVLDETEINTVTTNIIAFNSELKTAALTYNFAYVDGYNSIQQVVKGTQYEGITLTSEMVNGNQFSLDGLDIGAFGQATTANSCIDAINKKYGSTIPGIDATKFSGVIFH